MADPLYRKIAEDLQRKIETGELEPGQRLSNEEDFRAEYEAARNTVREAMRRLRSDVPASPIPTMSRR